MKGMKERILGNKDMKRGYVAPENKVYVMETAQGILAGSGGVANSSAMGNEYDGGDVTY